MALIDQYADDGLSPRVRGNRATCPAYQDMPGSIPACAGEPSTIFPYQTPIWVYPRVCGGTCFHDDATSTRNGLSPRVRGNPRFLSQGARQRRSIPACAGEPPVRQSDTATTQVYPRVCGGTKASLAAVPAGLGLSPRVRGNHS